MKYTIAFLLCAVHLVHPWPTCSDQAYCDEIRNSQTPTTWQVDPTTFQHYDDRVDAIVFNGDATANLTITSVSNDIFRITINDTGRFSPASEVLVEALERNTIVIADSATYTEFSSGPNTLVMFYNPLKFEVYHSGVLVMVINENGRLNFNNREDNLAISLDVKFFETQTAYGIPEHAEQLSLQFTGPGGKNPYRLFNSDYPAYPIGTQEALYGAVPVLYAHGTARSSGVFWLNSAETFVDIAHGDNQIESLFISESGSLDLFVLPGPTLQESILQYTSLTGVASLPPLFALGYHQCRWSYMDEADVMGVITGFLSNNFPMDVIWLDIDYTEDFKYFTWDFNAFPSPQNMIEYIVSLGKKVVAIIDPHIKVEEGYEIFDICKAYGYFVKASDGITDYEANCWPGLSSWIDFLHPAAASFYSSRFVYFVNRTEGLHIWNDMNEPAVFDVEEKTMPRDNVHYGNILHRDVHNIYGFGQTKATHQGLQYRSLNTRPFVLTRSHFAGSQRYTAVWTGDNVASWEHLKISIPMCLTLAISGISFCGADVGGFDGNPSEELLQRWYQTGAWLPFFRGHSAQHTDRREPYLFSQEAQTRFRHAMRERYFHLPLWYTVFYEHERYGEPVIRPLSYHYQSDMNTLSMDDQYLVGRNVLVHPVTDIGADHISIYLPGGGEEYWFDIVNNLAYAGGQYYTLPVTMDSIPVFYRSGSMLFRKEEIRSSSELTHDDPYTLYVFADSNSHAEGTIYYDDFESIAYSTNAKYYAYYQVTYDNGVIVYSKIDEEASFEKELDIEQIWVYRVNPKESRYQKAIVGSDEYPVVYADDDSHFVVDLNLTVKDDVVIRLV